MKILTNNGLRSDRFEVVKDFPSAGYIVWNIGRSNFPFKGYIPVCQLKDRENRWIDPSTLKAVKCYDEFTARFILKQAGMYETDWIEFMKMNKYGWFVDSCKKFAKNVGWKLHDSQFEYCSGSYTFYMRGDSCTYIEYNRVTERYEVCKSLEGYEKNTSYLGVAIFGYYRFLNDALCKLNKILHNERIKPVKLI
jgi:hypothetical protein